MANEGRIIRLAAPATTRVRYGRAVLTIARESNLNGGRLGEAIARYEQGEIDAEELCQRLVRTRVRDYTPSFGWDNADSQRLLRLVVEASDRPRFESVEPTDVAEQLVRGAQKEAEELKRFMKKLSEPFRASAKIEALLGRGQFDALAKAARIVTAYPDLGAAKVLDTHTRSLLGSNQFGQLNSKLADLGKITLGPEINQLLSQKFTGLGAASKVIDPKLFQTPDWLRTLPDPAPWLRRLQEQADSVVEGFKRALPVNWRELKTDEIDQVVELMKSEGLGLAWVPRPRIVRALLAAEGHNDRCAVLIRHCDEIIEDVEAALDDIDRHDLQDVAEAGREAIRTYHDGHPAPAQTYAAAAIGEVIHGPLGWEGFGEVRKVFKDKDPLHDVGYADFPMFAVGRALVRTLDRFNEAGDGFNRNLTQHRIGPPHSEPNLLMVLMLLAGLLREVQRALDHHEARETEQAA